MTISISDLLKEELKPYSYKSAEYKKGSKRGIVCPNCGYGYKKNDIGALEFDDNDTSSLTMDDYFITDGEWEERLLRTPFPLKTRDGDGGCPKCKKTTLVAFNKNKNTYKTFNNSDRKEALRYMKQ